MNGFNGFITHYKDNHCPVPPPSYVYLRVSLKGFVHWGGYRTPWNTVGNILLWLCTSTMNVWYIGTIHRVSYVCTYILIYTYVPYHCTCSYRYHTYYRNLLSLVVAGLLWSAYQTMVPYQLRLLLLCVTPESTETAKSQSAFLLLAFGSSHHQTHHGQINLVSGNLPLAL